MENWLVPIAVFTMIGFIVWVIFTSVRRYKTAWVQGEVAKTMLMRFDSAQSMLAYVETEGGRKFLSSLAQESGTAYGSILDCIRWGLIFLIVGGTLLLDARRAGSGPRRAGGRYPCGGAGRGTGSGGSGFLLCLPRIGTRRDSTEALIAGPGWKMHA